MFKWRRYPITKSCIKIRISLIDLRAVHTTLEELYKEGFTLKTRQEFLCPVCAGKICKRNNHLSLYICV